MEQPEELTPIPESTVPRLTGADDYRNVGRIFLGLAPIDYPVAIEDPYEAMMREFESLPIIRDDDGNLIEQERH